MILASESRSSSSKSESSSKGIQCTGMTYPTSRGTSAGSAAQEQWPGLNTRCYQMLEELWRCFQLLNAKPAWHGFTGNSHCCGSSWAPPHHLPWTGATLEVLTHLTDSSQRGVFFGEPKPPPFWARGPRRARLAAISAVNLTLAPRLPKIIQSRGNPYLISKCCSGAGIIQGLEA